MIRTVLYKNAILNCKADIPESASECMIQKGLGAKQNPEEEEKELLSSACFKHLVYGSISNLLVSEHPLRKRSKI